MQGSEKVRGQYTEQVVAENGKRLEGRVSAVFHLLSLSNRDALADDRC